MDWTAAQQPGREVFEMARDLHHNEELDRSMFGSDLEAFRIWWLHEGRRTTGVELGADGAGAR
jgi:hypothetical protein